MRRPTAHAPDLQIDPAELERQWAAVGEDADAAPACETIVHDSKRVGVRMVFTYGGASPVSAFACVLFRIQAS